MARQPTWAQTYTSPATISQAKPRHSVWKRQIMLSIAVLSCHGLSIIVQCNLVTIRGRGANQPANLSMQEIHLPGALFSALLTCLFKARASCKKFKTLWGAKARKRCSILL